MIDFKCVEAICRALKKHYPKMQVNSYGYGNMMLYDNYHQYINKNEYVKAMIFKSGPYNNYNYDEKCFILSDVIEFWWNSNMKNIIEICDIMDKVAKKYGCHIIRPLDRESIKLVEGFA